MDNQQLINKSQLLCLKYNPPLKGWKSHLLGKKQCTSLEITESEFNKTLQLAKKMLNEYKNQQQKSKQYNIYQIRKISQNSATPRSLTKQKNKFLMYQKPINPFNKAQKEIKLMVNEKIQNSSFYSKKSETQKSNSKKEILIKKPQTANTRIKTGEIKQYRNDFTKRISITPSQRIISIPVNQVTAKSWAIFNGNNGEFISGFNHNKSRQIASITKIMTCWVSLNLATQFGLNLDDTKFIVPDQAERVGGTTANLECGDRITIRDLLYGLMLPSGNDAAITLSHNYQKCSTEYEYFLKEMNRWAEQLELKQTRFGNVHGLSNEFSNSTAFDVGKMTYNVLQDPQFKSIVRTKIYFAELENQYGEIREMFWENTNKMLYQGFKGVKTGITTKAGPCVVEYYEDDLNSYIIVLLNCSSTDTRWQDAIKLLEWVSKTQLQ